MATRGGLLSITTSERNRAQGCLPLARLPVPFPGPPSLASSACRICRTSTTLRSLRLATSAPRGSSLPGRPAQAVSTAQQVVPLPSYRLRDATPLLP